MCLCTNFLLFSVYGRSVSNHLCGKELRHCKPKKGQKPLEPAGSEAFTYRSNLYNTYLTSRDKKKTFIHIYIILRVIVIGVLKNVTDVTLALDIIIGTYIRDNTYLVCPRLI